MPLTLSRRVTFVAKAEYFTTPGIKGWFQKKFFSGAGQVPIDRSGASAAEGALSSARRILNEGDLFGIYPEGTRSHDGKLYRGKTGVARLALECKVPVIPTAVVGTDVVAPPGQTFGKFTRPIVRFGKPLDFSRYEGMENDRYILRSITDEIMYEIMRLSGQEYVDQYATKAKEEGKRLEREEKAAAEAREIEEELRGTGEGVLTEAPIKPSPGRRAVPAGVRRALTNWFAPAMTVEDRMLRWLAVVRVIVLVNAVVLVAYRFDNVQKPLAAALCAVVMVAWTGFSIWAYLEPARRRPPLLLADLAVAVALIAMSPVVKGAGFSATIPGFWVMGALLAWAVHWRWVGGLVAGLVLSAVDLSVRQDIAQVNYANAFLLVLGGTIVGFLVESLQLMAAERDRAQRSAAAAVERARLARAVHDGVLQVLALVQRRGAELGDEAAELGRLAGEQEVALRTLIRAQDAVVPTANEAMVDLAAALSALGTRPGVHVATPGVAVEVPRATADELVAAVGACLDNVARHVGRGRSDLGAARGVPRPGRGLGARRGPRHPEGRLREAEDRGSAGRRRVDPGADCASWAGRRPCTPGPSGTEWELVAPLDPFRRIEAAVTIHSTHPFADAEPDEVRRFRGRLGRRGDAVDRRDRPTSGPA